MHHMVKHNPDVFILTDPLGNETVHRRLFSHDYWWISDEALKQIMQLMVYSHINSGLHIFLLHIFPKHNITLQGMSENTYCLFSKLHFDPFPVTG